MDTSSTNSKEERSFKEDRVRTMSFMYYSIPSIKKAIFEFSKNRECVPRYFEGFGKRPDTFQYESDIVEFVKKGATSFHSSQELWKDPLEISTELSRKEFDELRLGWDLLLDIDSPYLEYSKTYAEILINVLMEHGINNIGVKFSVSGDTDILIKVNDKIELTPISRAIELLKTGAQLETLSLDKKRKIKFSRIYNFLEHEDILYEVFHSQSKIPLKSTGHHSVFIWDKGDILEKKVTELKKGDFLISYNSRNNPLVKNTSKINHEFKFSKNQHSSKILKKEIKITHELMRLIGYFLAEGHTTKTINETGFSFNKKEEEYINDCKNILYNLTKRKISVRSPNPNSIQILIHSKEWHDFFKIFCGEKKEKHIPEFSWRLPKDLFLEMLRGYIRGDGYKIGEYGIVIKSVSKRLIKEFIWLCKLNDISCSLSSEQNKPHKLPQGNNFKGSFVYILKIPKSELPSLEFNRSRNKFSPYPGDKVFPVDGLNLVYKKINPGMFNYHRSEQMTLKKKTANLSRIRKVLDWFSKYKTIKWDEECKRIISNYEKLFDSEICIVKIKNILKKEKDKVYDISVEETESFFGNDFPVLLHNSGSKGFHIIIPWKAFPKEIYNQKTKDMFPEWPRMICGYLLSKIKKKLDDEIYEKYEKGEGIQEIAKKMGKTESELVKITCKSCNRPSIKKELVTWICPNCKNELTMIRKTKRVPKCPNENCRTPLEESFSKPIDFCEFCNLDSKRNPEMFETIFKSSVEADLILVSPRHLFRMPYSLHEKTSLASVVIDKNEIRDFDIKKARPLNLKIKSFYPDSKEEEAKELLLKALDWNEQKEKQEKIIKNNVINSKPITTNTKPTDFKKVIISNPSEEIFPPCIKSILNGVKQDGRKRALFILINFFKSIGLSDVELEKKINTWNEKNYQPLKNGYIQSQVIWFKRNSSMLPPNCDKPHYKDLGVCHPDELCKQIKNPVNYAMKKYFRK